MNKIASPVQLAREVQEILSYTTGARPSRRFIASQLVDLAQRVAGVRTSSRGTPLYGHTDMNSAYPVDDYPYGRQLRCKIRYWLESDPRKGFRFVSQTEDPRKLKWNNPKKSTYSMLGGCMYLDAKDHVVWTGLTEYSNEADVLSFVKDFPRADYSILRPFTRAKLKYLEGKASGKHVTTINGVPQPVREEDIGRAKKELDQWEDIAKMIH